MTETRQEVQWPPSVRDADRTDAGGFMELWRPEETQKSSRGPEQVLLEQGHVTATQIDSAVLLQQDNPRLSLLGALVQLKAIDDVTAMRAIAEYFHLPFRRLVSTDIDPDVFELLPPDFVKAKHACTIARDDDAIVVALTDPADIFLIDDLKRRLRKRLRLVVAPESDILRAAEDLAIAPTQQVDDIIKDIAEDAVEVVEESTEDVSDLERIAGESPVIRYVNFLITSSVREGASDIHIEPGEKRLRIRFRVDGMLFEQHGPPLAMHAAIISRLKIMANLDIAERRLPQDGRIRATVKGRAIDLRVSTLPTTHGEKCVIRILDERATMVGLENLGMTAETLSAYRKQILQPHGIVLVTGPTGSGKSTTLYSSLRIMDGDRLNISTVEDPVEYQLPVANQVNVREAIGLTFSAALRSLLRQDPDVVMVGEIRDAETARIAVQASLTGHMVLSTLHTNDAPSSITRLVNIGVEPFLIAVALNAVIAQRLVRRICENCKTPAKELSASTLAYLEQAGMSSDQVFVGAGCDKCRQTGYKGRLGIYELLEMTEEMRDLVTRNAALGEIRRLTRENGMRSLRDDGLLKVATGQTTLEEILRVTET